MDNGSVRQESGDSQILHRQTRILGDAHREADVAAVGCSAAVRQSRLTITVYGLVVVIAERSVFEMGLGTGCGDRPIDHDQQVARGIVFERGVEHDIGPHAGSELRGAVIHLGHGGAAHRVGLAGKHALVGVGHIDLEGNGDIIR